MQTFRLPAAFALALALAFPAAAASHKPAHHKPERRMQVRIEPTQAPDGSLKSAWIQYGPNGTLDARAIVDGTLCPEISVDGHDWVMDSRAAPGPDFLLVCRAELPAGAHSASLVFRKTASEPPAAARDLDIVPLPLPVADPQRILVMGDTGCRIKGKTLQACSDPQQWPFPEMAAEEARLKPDLVVDVGDYQYRESPCPAGTTTCSGPYGDNWPTWDADFFTPAKPLLAAAPWVMTRGNHEDCQRSGAGWLRLLGPQSYDPAAPCIGHFAPYAVSLGKLNLVVMDDADAPDTKAPADLVPVYRNEFAALAQQPSPTWLVMHRPIWAAISGPLGIPAGGNLTMTTAIGSSGIPSSVTLMLAGHIHTFEAINYDKDDHVPPQVVAGFGGDLLDPTPRNLHGTVFQGDTPVRVADGLSIGGFGFLLMTKNDDGWTIDVHDVHGHVERQCTFQDGRVDCPKGK